MTEKTEKLLEEIRDQLKFANSDNRLWSTEDIATYLGQSPGSVQNRIVCKTDFPRAVSIKTDSGHTQRRWYPEEVKEWVKAQRDKGRPRSAA